MPTLKIHFTQDDLARVRVAEELDPLWELVLSLHRLRRPEGGPLFAGWRPTARARVGTTASLLLPLVPPAGYFADFLTPPESASGLDRGIEAVMATPRARLRTDLATLSGSAGGLPSWASTLAAGGPAAAQTMTRIGKSLRDYYNAVVAPDLPMMRSHVEADRARRVRAVLSGGSEGLLASLRPHLHWQPPVLRVDYPVDQDLHLNGRGLMLVPSFFCLGRPVSLLDGALSPVLVYPVDRDALNSGGSSGVVADHDQVLGSLIGRTRAGILRALKTTCTTTELARRLGVSLASASQHTAVLRNAGLISTRRQGGHVLHTLTQLGADLLTGGPSHA